MTHDELLAKIDYELKAAEFEDACGDGGHPPTHKALRAVVELHKPEKQSHREYEKCWNCDLVYPCPTIQAIEEVLNG